MMDKLLYQKAITELSEYYEGHGTYGDCSADSKQRDTDGNCILSEAHFARESKNLNPSEEDIGIAIEWLITEADMRNITDDESYDPDHPEEDEEGRGYVNFLINSLETIKGGNDG
jgi:flagellar basal body rod protein FlgC